MTTKQLVARIKKYFRLYGEQDLNNMALPIYSDMTGEMVTAEKLVIDDGDVGVLCLNGSWFIPLDELIYKELSMIMRTINKNINQK